MALPFITVLEALKAELAQALDGMTVAGQTVLVRHHRHRETLEEEWPCLAVRFVSNDVSQLGRETTDSGMPEAVWELAVDLVIDCALPAEADPGEVDVDPTGYGTPAAITQAAIEALFPGDGEPSDLGGVAWDLRYDGSADDENAQSPDFMRMVERLVVLYRVRADQPTLLLTGV